MIESLGLQKKFGSRSVIKNISFTANDGEITGLLGVNGAGKTTVLRMIAGVLTPSAGDAEINGLSVRRNSSEAQAALGCLLGHTGIYSRLTARENLMYFGHLRQIPSDRLESMVDDVLNLLDLTELADTPTTGFSLGERMKVALGRSLVHSPSNLLLDEPTIALDILSVRNLRKFLERMREQGHCIVLSSHVLEEVQALCDRIAILHSGTIVVQGTIQEVCHQTQSPDLEAAFLNVTSPAKELL
jgi:sodium transport system ATP-binding protein